jgi:hypothetical protein
MTKAKYYVPADLAVRDHLGDDWIRGPLVERLLTGLPQGT